MWCIEKGDSLTCFVHFAEIHLMSCYFCSLGISCRHAKTAGGLRGFLLPSLLLSICLAPNGAIRWGLNFYVLSKLIKVREYAAGAGRALLYVLFSDRFAGELLFQAGQGNRIQPFLALRAGKQDSFLSGHSQRSSQHGLVMIS